MSTDDAYPQARRESQGWMPPGEEGDMFAPPPAPVSLRGTYAPLIIPSVVPTSGFAIASLILGLATFLTGGISGIFAVVFGHLAARETKSGARNGHGMAVAGLILGYVAIAGWILFLLLLSIGVIGAASAGPPASASRTWVYAWA